MAGVDVYHRRRGVRCLGREQGLEGLSSGEVLLRSLCALQPGGERGRGVHGWGGGVGLCLRLHCHNRRQRGGRPMGGRSSGQALEGVAGRAGQLI